VVEPCRGKLLVATPELPDPNFARTVVLVLEHSDEGALGVVLNRPTDSSLVESLPRWADRAAPPAVVFVGGPVQPDAAIGLARRAAADTDEPDGGGFATLFDRLGTVDLELGPEEITPAVEAVRVFVGYSGWGPGQLDGELAAEGWYVCDADADDLWTAHPNDLWRAVLRRQPGPLRLVAGFPDDPSQN
jgi:putative transcriptional regulator